MIVIAYSRLRLCSLPRAEAEEVVQGFKNPEAYEGICYCVREATALQVTVCVALLAMGAVLVGIGVTPWIRTAKRGSEGRSRERDPCSRASSDLGPLHLRGELAALWQRIEVALLGALAGCVCFSAITFSQIPTPASLYVVMLIIICAMAIHIWRYGRNDTAKNRSYSRTTELVVLCLFVACEVLSMAIIVAGFVGMFCCSIMSPVFGWWVSSWFLASCVGIALSSVFYSAFSAMRWRLREPVGVVARGSLLVVSTGAVLSWTNYRNPELPIAVSGFGGMLIVLAWVAGRLWHERVARKIKRE